MEKSGPMMHQLGVGLKVSGGGQSGWLRRRWDGGDSEREERTGRGGRMRRRRGGW
jgi:hypothetical protein